LPCPRRPRRRPLREPRPRNRRRCASKCPAERTRVQKAASPPPLHQLPSSSRGHAARFPPVPSSSRGHAARSPHPEAIHEGVYPCLATCPPVTCRFRPRHSSPPPRSLVTSAPDVVFARPV